MEYTEVRWNPSAVIFYHNIDIAFPSNSIAMGLGLNYIVSEIIFLTGNVSILYGIKSQMDIQLDAVARDMDGYITSQSYSYNDPIGFKLWGANVEPSLGAKIGPSLVATLGARFQWLQYTSEKSIPAANLSKGDTLNDYLFGIFVSLMYIF